MTRDSPVDHPGGIHTDPRTTRAGWCSGYPRQRSRPKVRVRIKMVRYRGVGVLVGHTHRPAWRPATRLEHTLDSGKPSSILRAGLFIVVLIGLAGCGGKQSGAHGADGAAGTCVGSRAGESPSSTSAASLMAAARTLLAQDFAFSIVGEGGDEVTDPAGNFDADTKGVRVITYDRKGEEGTADKALELVQIDTDLWLSGNGRRFHADTTRLESASILWSLWTGSPSFVCALVQTSTQVTQDGPSKFTGTVDLQAVPSGDRLSSHLATQLLRTTPPRWPFTAEIDREGRLASFRATPPMTGDTDGFEFEFATTSFGKAISVEKPEGRFEEAPDAFYSTPGSD